MFGPVREERDGSGQFSDTERMVSLLLSVTFTK